jgi:hypothetical protein
VEKEKYHDGRKLKYSVIINQPENLNDFTLFNTILRYLHQFATNNAVTGIIDIEYVE